MKGGAVMLSIQMQLIDQDIFITDENGYVCHVSLDALSAYQWYNISDICRCVKDQVKCTSLIGTLDAARAVLDKKVSDFAAYVKP